ncbi:A1pp-domain-containing protein [Mollisia scopiformis]|uniref:A1pp-domain-containing protein n=1 Tax=Mollisia scopiformis TaxID=149040 RepID=A0A194X8I7_MOLSC|nr:A1pp-domain-containing protein [Mollisia scopiformis]KUJ16480.1 A1pp-domain-containing protein [Mollisia scopiformis]
MANVPVTEIPTVSLLYRLKKLAPAQFQDESERPQPSQSFNDRIGLIRGDITKLEVGAIVNAANNSLLGGGGVDGAIHRAAGPKLLKECRRLKGCDTGSAKITGAYELPCQKVIHAVGPVFNSRFEQECAEDLAGCYTTSLELAVANKCKSIAFSALSTGIYGYPSDEAAPVAIKAVKDFLEGEDGDKLEKVVFCTFVQKDVDAYNHWLPRFFPSTEPEAEDEWEEVEGGESAENGPATQEEKAKDTEEAKEEKEAEKKEEEAPVELPDVPTTEPASESAEDGPATKKQKSGDEEKL